jgi:hypothetical protein
MSKRTGILLFILGFVICLAIIAITTLKNPAHDYDEVATAMVKTPPAWREIARKSELSEAFELPAWKSWTFSAIPAKPNARVRIEGTFTAAPPKEVDFALMDADNFERFKAGFPPLVIYSVHAGERIQTLVPVGAGYSYVFVRKPPEQKAARIPTSISDLLMLALQSQAGSQPARVTVELQKIVECFCSEQEAALARSQILQK